MTEAVPNFSEGRRPEVVARLAAATAPGLLLDVHADADHNRSVVSLCGLPDRLEEGLLAAIAEAVRLVDLRSHTGVHPRVGAADVVPLVPLVGTLEEAAEDARRLAARVWSELGLPVYLYGPALAGPSLAEIRAGRARPSLGGDPHPASGAVCIGARRALVAYNVLLPAAPAPAAAELARSIRASSPGGIPGVQALAFRLASGVMQLSMNLFDLSAAPPGLVLAEIRARAAARGLAVGDDEVVGLCPAAWAPPSAGGRVLEAREGAAVAREAGDEPLAERLGAIAASRQGFAEAAATVARLRPQDSQLRAVAEHAAAALLAASRAA